MSTLFSISSQVLAPIARILAEPQIKNWIRLIAVGIASLLSQRLFYASIVWVQDTFCITSVHHLTDESFDGLMGRCHFRPETEWTVTYNSSSLTAFWIQDPKWQGSSQRL